MLLLLHGVYGVHMGCRCIIIPKMCGSVAACTGECGLALVATARGQ